MGFEYFLVDGFFTAGTFFVVFAVFTLAEQVIGQVADFNDLFALEAEG